MTNKDNTEPLDPGCPYCAGPLPHPHSSPPGVLAPSPKTAPSPNAPMKALPAKFVAVPEAEPDGKLVYDMWVEDVGHGLQAMPWDKLGKRAQQTWVFVARKFAAVVERRIIERLVAEQMKNQQASRRDKF
jgi:hypothetical protein